MLTKEEAIKKVEMKIKALNAHVSNQPEIVIINSDTIEKDWGWVFFYQSSEYLKTGNFRSQLGGNAPYIVNKESGELIETGTVLPIEQYIASYEQSIKAS